MIEVEFPERRTETTRRVDSVSNARILDNDWPPDLDPVTVPFTARTETVQRRAA